MPARRQLHSVTELNDQLTHFIGDYNQTMAHPFRWTYTGKPLEKPRASGHSEYVDHECCEPDEAGEVFEGLFVTGGDSAELFDAVEESFHLVAVFVAGLVVTFPSRPVLVRFDAGFGLQPADFLSCFITVVGGVAEDLADLSRFEGLKQLSTLGAIAILSRSEAQLCQLSLLIDRHVNLRVQAAAGSAQAASSIGVFFFSAASRRPPTADRWTLIEVESSCNSSRSSSPSTFAKSFQTPSDTSDQTAAKRSSTFQNARADPATDARPWPRATPHPQTTGCPPRPSRDPPAFREAAPQSDSIARP